MPKKKISSSTIKQAAGIVRAVSHPERLRIIESLENRPMTVRELTDELNAAQVTVSKHLGVLRKYKVVTSEVKRHFRIYSIAYRNVLNILDCIRKHAKS